MSDAPTYFPCIEVSGSARSRGLAQGRAVPRRVAASGRLLHAHNWDWREEAADSSIVLRVRGENGPDILTLVEAGGLARHGFNTAGVALTANFLASDRDFKTPGVPLAVLRRKILEQPNLAAAAKVPGTTRRSCSNNIMLSQADGEALDLECVPDECFWIQPEGGLLAHSNHFISASARARVRDTYFGTNPDTLYRVTRVHDYLAARTVQAAGTIRVAANSEIRGTNPGVNRDANTDTVMLHMIEGLVGYKDDGTPAPLLAQSIDVSKDGKTYTFKLRPGVKFHNGAPLTSADVVWSWKRYLDPNTKWLCLAEFDGSQSLRIESVEAKDPLTVVFKLNQARPLFLTQIASFQCGSGGIIHKDSVNADGSWKAPIGTGPFKLGEWKRGEWIELTAFKDYKSAPGKRDGYVGAKDPLVDSVRWIVIKDDAARRAALEKGQVDLMPGLRPTELTEMGNPPQLEVRNASTMSVNALLIQVKDPVMSNAKLRQALAASLQTTSIATIASGGSGTVNASMVPAPSSYHAGPHNVAHKFDVGLAKKLLAEAGYKGQPIKMITNRRYPDMYEQSVMIQGMAKQAGINVELEVL